MQMANEIILIKNQSVENAGVVFVKGANERNDFFEKINKQRYMWEAIWDEQGKWLSDLGMNTFRYVLQRLVYHCPNRTI